MKKNKKIELLDALNTVKQNEGAAFFYSPGIYKNESSWLLSRPSGLWEAYNREEFKSLINRLNSVSDGMAAGYIAYEAGCLMDKSPGHLSGMEKSSEEDSLKSPLAGFYIYDKENIRKLSPKDISYEKLESYLPDDNFNSSSFRDPDNKCNDFTIKEFGINDFKVSDFRINNSKEEYTGNIEKIKNYIACGDTYQVNYTVKSRFSFSGDILSLLISLIFNQSARYIAFINDKDRFIISLSPELFFKTHGRILNCRPMKGTHRRGYNSLSDEENLRRLKMSPKDRSENVMIVDLLRNDMGRISETGSVKVKKLFEIEKYETLFQMTSSIESRLRPEIKISDVIENLFPCGSITGAPKIRTMEIINELEKEERNIYTGAVGIIEKDRAVFNVPIRTLLISKKDGKGEMGLGSGIVWDSSPVDEFRETNLKGNFLISPDPGFKIFTTMLLENESYFLLEMHLRRLRETADYFLFNYDEKKIMLLLSKILKASGSAGARRVKVILDKWGNCRSEVSEYPGIKEPVKVLVSDRVISSGNKFQYYKTTNRRLYDEELRKARDKGFGEVIFFNEKGELAEGSFTNIFIRKNMKWLTPGVSSGILNGIYRQYLLGKFPEDYTEEILTSDDLKNAGEIILTNSLRKVIPVSGVFFG